MKKIIITFTFQPLLFFAQNRGEYVGDIKFDEKTDRKNFELCNPNYIFQYFNNSGGFQYKGEKIALEQEFARKYNPKIVNRENAMVRIRFVVNCKSESDRFRLLVSDYNYQPTTIDSKITDQLLSITKSLNGWIPKKYHDKPIDYYQYLIFKIKDGKIDEILP